MPVNGGTAEYANIVSSQTQTATKIDDVRALLEAQFRKSIGADDIISVVDDVDDVFRVASSVPRNTASTLVPPNILEKLGEATAGLRNSLSNIKIAAPSIGEGGMSGLTAFGSKALFILGRVCQVIFLVQTVIDLILWGYTLLSNIVSELSNRLTDVDSRVNVLEPAHQRTRRRVDGLEAGLRGTEILARQAFSNANLALNLGNANSTRITELEAQVANLEELIKSNHAATMLSFENTFTWQENNKSEKTATLSRAAIERDNGMLFQTAEVISKAVEGSPPEAAGDADYQNFIGSPANAIATGTLGYAIFKNRQAITSTVTSTASGIKTAVTEGVDVLKTQGAKLGKIINLGQITQTVSIIISLHNALILSRDIGQTLLQVVDNGLNAALNALGIKNVDDEGVSTDKALKDFINSIATSIFGAQTWAQIQSSWAAANRITASANTLLWSVRDLADTASSMAEMAAENSGKIGNALRRSGVTQDVGKWFPENYTRETVFQEKIRQGLQGVQNTAEAFENVTSSVLQTQQTLKEIKDNNDNFLKTLGTDASKIRVDNKPVKDASTAAKSASQGPDITELDTKPSPQGEG